MRPGILLRAEGLAVLAAAVALYTLTDAGWWFFAILFLAPDLSMLGYLAGPRAGSVAYNAIHTYAGPVALTILATSQGWETASAIGLIWLAHIGIDRLLGFGLKYPTAFKDTHLQRV
jgi:hypothetical protein